MKTSTVNILEKNLQRNPFFVKDLQSLQRARAGEEKPLRMSRISIAACCRLSGVSSLGSHSLKPQNPTSLYEKWGLGIQAHGTLDFRIVS